VGLAGVYWVGARRLWAAGVNNPAGHMRLTAPPRSRARAPASILFGTHNGPRAPRYALRAQTPPNALRDSPRPRRDRRVSLY
jgi:hypothetical protein